MFILKIYISRRLKFDLLCWFLICILGGPSLSPSSQTILLLRIPSLTLSLNYTLHCSIGNNIVQLISHHHILESINLIIRINIIIIMLRHLGHLISSATPTSSSLYNNIISHPPPLWLQST